MKAWFAQFSPRDQLSLLALAAALCLYLFYQLAWAPLGHARDEMARRNESVAESLQRVDSMVSELVQLRDQGSGSSGAQRNLTALVNQSTAAAGLSVSRLQPNSRGEIQVRLESAAFDELLAWLHQIEVNEGLLVREVSVSQSGTVGRVNATIQIGQGA